MLSGEARRTADLLARRLRIALELRNINDIPAG
jgi:hypothetical protein